MKIPQQINFIWAGGNKLLPLNNMDAILAWHRDNPDFEIWLWIDKQSQPIDLISHYSVALQERAEALGIGLSLEKIKFKDISEEAIVTPFIRYEIDRLRPNYGASSDMTRYRMLFQVGGAYFDSDIFPGSRPLQGHPIFSEDSDEHRLYIDGNSQDAHGIGNDLFITTAHNPLLRYILDFTEQHYRTHEEFGFFDETTDLQYTDGFHLRDDLHTQTYSYDVERYLERITVFRTGPGSVRSVCEPILASPELQSRQLVRFITDDMRSHERAIGLAWLTRKTRPCASVQEASEITAKTAKFEVEVMGMLRMDDHIRNVMEATSCDSQTAINALFAALANEDIAYRQVRVAQLTYYFPETEQFYQAHDIAISKTFIYPDLSGDILDQNRYYQILRNLCHVDELIAFRCNHGTLENTEDERIRHEQYIKHACAILQKVCDYCLSQHAECNSNDRFRFNLQRYRMVFDDVYGVVTCRNEHFNPAVIVKLESLKEKVDALHNIIDASQNKLDPAAINDAHDSEASKNEPLNPEGTAKLEDVRDEITDTPQDTSSTYWRIPCTLF